LDLKKYQARVSRPASRSAIRVAVIGAELSGLVATRTISDHGHQVQVFEKARGPGGSMSTRRMGAYSFDHGVQYFTVRDERFEKLVDSWMQSGIEFLNCGEKIWITK
jgi:hypothetical protein